MGFSACTVVSEPSCLGSVGVTWIPWRHVLLTLGAMSTMLLVPKMAIRFFSFELYKDMLGRDPVTGKTSFWATFLAGLGAGTTESVMVVTPMVCLCW